MEPKNPKSKHHDYFLWKLLGDNLSESSSLASGGLQANFGGSKNGWMPFP